MSGSRGARGQTESIGVVLLAGIVILSIGTFGAFYLESISDQSQLTAADIDVVAVNESGSTTLTVIHAGGESLDEGTVIVQSSGTTYPLPDPFEEGRAWTTTFTGAPAGSTLRVQVVENDTHAVVFDSRVTVQDS